MTLTMTLAIGKNPLILDCYLILVLCVRILGNGLIMCLLHRAKKICSSAELYVQELKRLRHIFCNNGYPDWYVNTP